MAEHERVDRLHVVAAQRRWLVSIRLPQGELLELEITIPMRCGSGCQDRIEVGMATPAVNQRFNRER